MEEKEAKTSQEKPDFVKWFDELTRDSGKYAGGKGANLAEIFNLGIPVPPGFVVTAQAYDYFIEKAGIKKQIHELLDDIDYENTKQLDEKTEKIRKLIFDSSMPKEMQDEILESYDNLDDSGLDIERGSVLSVLNKSEPVFVAVRSSATAEDLADASFAGQQDTYLNVKGRTELIKHVKKCFASLFTSRATYYRAKKGFDHAKVSLAVVVQKMIDSDKSGVMFSKDPSYKRDDILIEAVWGLGEGIVSGQITPDTYIVSRDLEIKSTKISNKKLAITRDSGGGKAVRKLREEKSQAQVLKNYEIKRLSEYALQLEQHYNHPQDIEFAIEGDEIFIVQTRPVTTLKTRQDASLSNEIKGEIILQGLAASPGIASGTVKIVNSLQDLQKVGKGDILVTKMTNPDMVVTMQKSSAIITDEGGMTAHAAIVSREMGIPCVVGTQEATEKLKDEEIITVDGFAGKIYKGKVAESTQKEVKPVEAQTKTKIKVIVDLPSFAERAAKTQLKQVGLTRIEGIIAESGKHPRYFLMKNKTKDYEEVIFNGVNKIAEYFDELWVRTSDIRTDEFKNLEGAPQESEANPMLGYHGIRYSLDNPELLKAELNALKRIADKGKTIGILMPQVILLDELKKTKAIIKEIGFENCKVGIMIETPAAVQLIRDFVEEGIDFVSFGTNDLTQYMLAIDRGNESVQHLYDEMHPAILYQLGYVIRVCKRAGVETSICGQAGSKKPMAKYLVEQGITSITTNADMAAEIAEYVAEIEESLIKGTDKEPRQYQPEKNNSNPKSNEKQLEKPIQENSEQKNQNPESVLDEDSDENLDDEEDESPAIKGINFL